MSKKYTYKAKGERKAKVFLGVGHGGADQGAVKYENEQEANLVMAKACKNYLVNRGVEVCMSRNKDEADPVDEEVRECNAYGPSLAIDVHNNSGGGDGFEIYYYSGGGKSKVLANNIEHEVVKIGQNSRGCKTRLLSNGVDYYAFIRDTNAPACICEGFFVDNRTDVKIADTTKEQQAFGYAYARGILRTLGIEDRKVGEPSKGPKPTAKPKPKPTPERPPKYNTFTVKVTADVLNIRKTPNTDYEPVGKVLKGGVYTIVQKQGSWGRLKSGAGWINLNYTKAVK